MSKVVELSILLKYYYEDDVSLLSKYHILAPTTLPDAVIDTAICIDSIMDMKPIMTFEKEFYSVILDKHLFAWCIKKEFRNTAKELFLKNIEKIETASVYKKNTRALFFLLKNNFNFVSEEFDFNRGELFINLKKELCL